MSYHPKLGFQHCEAVIFDPKWWDEVDHKGHPLTKGQLVYFLGLIPNVPGHCIVATSEGKVIPMIHPEELRLPKEDEL